MRKKIKENERAIKKESEKIRMWKHREPTLHGEWPNDRCPNTC